MIQLVGFGGVYAQEIIQTLERLGKRHSEMHASKPFGSSDNSFPKELASSSQVMISHIAPDEKLELANMLSSRGELEFATVVDPSSVVASNAQIGHGSYLNALVSVGAKTTISCHAMVNRSSSIAHDCRLDSFVSTGPSAVLCSSVSVGFGSFVGAGAVVRDGIRIGKHAVIGAGAVVLRDVEDYEVVVGNPARTLKLRDYKPEIERCPWCNN